MDFPKKILFPHVFPPLSSFQPSFRLVPMAYYTPSLGGVSMQSSMSSYDYVGSSVGGIGVGSGSGEQDILVGTAALESIGAKAEI